MKITNKNNIFRKLKKISNNFINRSDLKLDNQNDNEKKLNKTTNENIIQKKYKKFKKKFSKKDNYYSVNYFYNKFEKKNWHKNIKKKKGGYLNLLPFSLNQNIEPNNKTYNNIKKNLTINIILNKKENINNKFQIIDNNIKKNYINKNFILRLQTNNIDYYKNKLKFNFSKFFHPIKKKEKILIKKYLEKNIYIKNLNIISYNFLLFFDKKINIKIFDIFNLNFIEFNIIDKKVYINENNYLINDIRDILYNLNINLIAFCIIKNEKNIIIDMRFLNLKSPFLYNEKLTISNIKNFIKKSLEIKTKIHYKKLNKYYIIEFNHKLKKYI